MSWFFGKKKPEPSITVDPNPPPAHDYYRMYPGIPGMPSANSLPYAVQPVEAKAEDPAAPVPPTRHLNYVGHGDPGAQEVSSPHPHPVSTHPLDGVPFKLSSLLDTSAYSWTDMDSSHFITLLRRASQLHKNMDYSFKTEESVLKEITLCNESN